VVRAELEGQQRAEAVLQRTGRAGGCWSKGGRSRHSSCCGTQSAISREQELKQLLAEARQQMLAQERREAVEKAAGQARGQAEQQDFAGPYRSWRRP